MHEESTKNKHEHGANKNERAKCRLQRINMHGLWLEIPWAGWSRPLGQSQGQQNWVTAEGLSPLFPLLRAVKMNLQKVPS